MTEKCAAVLFIIQQLAEYFCVYFVPVRAGQKAYMFLKGGGSIQREFASKG